LLPILRAPEARKEMGLDDDVFKPKLDAYLAEMQKRFDDELKGIQPGRGTDWAKVLSGRMEQENIEFEKFLDQLTEAQRERLIGLFVQARSYRAVSNRIVAAKLGLTAEEASAKRKDIDAIREETILQSRDRVRRIFDKGGDPREFEKVMQENLKKMDARIEESLTQEQRDKLKALRGEEVSEPREWLIHSVQMRRPGPPAPLPPPPPQSQSQSREAIKQ
jgi:hypothetical protein